MESTGGALYCCRPLPAGRLRTHLDSNHQNIKYTKITCFFSLHFLWKKQLRKSLWMLCEAQWLYIVWKMCVCVCICAWRCSCSCLLSFNLGSSIDSTQTGSCYNFLDTCYYAAWQLSAISRSLKSHDNPPCLQKRKEKKKSICLKHSEWLCE